MRSLDSSTTTTTNTRFDISFLQSTKNRYFPGSFVLLFVSDELRLLTVPYFSVGFSRLVRFDRTSAILVCKGERNLWRVPKLLTGGGSGEAAPPRLLNVLTRAPLGSLGTLPRLRSPLQTKMAEVRSKHMSFKNPTEKWGTVNSL